MTTRAVVEHWRTAGMNGVAGSKPNSPRVRGSLPLFRLSDEFWRFLSASVFFDFGFGLFFFLFNLYLSAAHFNERSIGLFTSALTIGSLVATMPAGFIARRYGLRPLLAVCLVVAPALGIVRTFLPQPAWQLVGSFLFGVAMCGWAICTPTALARVTDVENRSIGFSLNFAVGIGAGVLAGLIGGSLPAKLTRIFALPDAESGMRFTLVLACLAVLPGTLALGKRQFLARSASDSVSETSWLRMDRFRLHFLAGFAVWSTVSAAFAPFASVYLMRRLNMPLTVIGEIFAASQLAQVVTVLSSPLLIKRVGTIRSTVLLQISAGTMLLLLGRTRSHSAVVVELILLNALQYMANPGIYALLMTRTPDVDRGTASAAQSLVSSLAGASAAAAAGIVTFRYGYTTMFSLLAAIAIASAGLFLTLPDTERIEIAAHPEGRNHQDSSTLVTGQSVRSEEVVSSGIPS